jgi:hypothetical protein
MPSFIYVVLLLGVDNTLFRYETRKKFYEREGCGTMNAVIRASTEASILTTLITQPIWVIKTRMLLNMNQNIS